MSKFTKTFDEPGDFASWHAAGDWLRARGYSYGSMCSPLPTAVMLGDWSIAKWKHLSAKERRDVDGTLTANSYRYGPVTITLNAAPEEPGKIEA